MSVFPEYCKYGGMIIMILEYSTYRGMISVFRILCDWLVGCGLTAHSFSFYILKQKSLATQNLVGILFMI